MNKKIVPYDLQDCNKTEEVRQMFDNISNHYDFLNDLLSVGFGRIWRKKAIKALLYNGFSPTKVLDVASGTGDFAINIYDCLKDKSQVTGIDLSDQMLKVAIKKAGKRNISFIQADGENIPFADNYFDALSCSYGIRNFENPQKGLFEFHRVLKSSGRVVIVELSEPKNIFLKRIFGIYFSSLVPIMGGAISGDREAYSYLPKSVSAFPSRKNFISMMENAGFTNCVYYNLFGGIATLYFAEKL